MTWNKREHFLPLHSFINHDRGLLQLDMKKLYQEFKVLQQVGECFSQNEHSKHGVMEWREEATNSVGVTMTAKKLFLWFIVETSFFVERGLNDEKNWFQSPACFIHRPSFCETAKKKKRAEENGQMVQRTLGCWLSSCCHSSKRGILKFFAFIPINERDEKEKEWMNDSSCEDGWKCGEK